MYKRIVTAALVFGMAAVAPPSLAQTVCDAHQAVAAQLGSVYDEQLAGVGLSDGLHLVELWTSKDGATWTLLVSRADGLTCVLDSGSAWLSYTEAGTKAEFEG